MESELVALGGTNFSGTLVWGFRCHSWTSTPGSTRRALYPFLGEGSPTKTEYRNPYSNLSPGGPTHSPSGMLLFSDPELSLPVVVSNRQGAPEPGRGNVEPHGLGGSPFFERTGVWRVIRANLIF